MKAVFVIAGVLASVATAQFNVPQGFPPCGQTCIANLVNELGSPKIQGCNSGDLKCLCGKPEFAYGIRDCTYASCGSSAGQLASQIFAVPIEACRAVGVDISGNLGGAPNTGGGNNGGNNGGNTSASVSTSTTTTTANNGGSTSSAGNGDNNSGSATTYTTGTATTNVVSTNSDGQTTTSAVATASGVVTSTASSGNGGSTSRSATSAGASTSSNFAAIQTAAPGLIAAAGFAALLL